MDQTYSYKYVLPPRIRRKYAFCETRDAAAVIANTNPEEFKEIVKVLTGFELVKKDITTPGGGKSRVPVRLDGAFSKLGWREGQYKQRVVSTLKLMPYRKAGELRAKTKETEVVFDGYKVDNVKGKIALDVEWNAKDGNLDRDLAAYRALYEVGIITAGVIVTRHFADIRKLARDVGRMKGFGTTTTTNIEKLTPRLERGDAGGCPVLVVAINRSTYSEN